MNIEAIFRRPRGEQTDRRRRGGEVDMDRSCHIPIQFLGDRNCLKSGVSKDHRNNLKVIFCDTLEGCNRSVYQPAAVLGCYLQIIRTMRGREGERGG